MVVSTPELVVKVGLAGFLIIIGILFLKKKLGEEETKSQKYFFIGIAMLALMSSLTRIFFLFTDYLVRDTPIYNLFWKLAVVSSFSALIFIALVVETYLVKSKYVCSAVGIVGTILIIFLNLELARQLMAVIYLIIGFEIFLLYLYVAYKSPGMLRRKSLLMILSMLIFLVGVIFDSESVWEGIIPFDMGLIGAILMWIGLGYYLKLNY